MSLCFFLDGTLGKKKEKSALSRISLSRIFPGMKVVVERAK